MISKLTTRRAVGLAAAVIAAAPVLAFRSAQAAAPEPTTPPPTETCTTIPNETARVVRRPLRYSPFPFYTLTVTGQTPVFNMKVRLVRHTYIQRPEYWGIEVQGCRTGDVSLPAQKPYTVQLQFQGSMGTRGIEVIGANRTQRFDLPGRLLPVPSTTVPEPPTDPIVPPPV